MPRSKPKKPKVSLGKRLIDLLFSQTGLVTLTAIVLAFIGTYYAFKTRIDVSPGTLLVRDDPFSTPFTLINSGWLSIYDVRWSVITVGVDYNSGFRERKNFHGSTKNIPELKSGDKTTMDIEFAHRVDGSKVSKMEILCVLGVRNYFFSERPKRFRFVCFLTPDGEYHWMPFEGQTSVENKDLPGEESAQP